MSTEIVHADDEFDFSKYRAGDVICIPMREIKLRGQAASIMLVASIANAASRAGLNWETVRDEMNDELRVSFS